jgi:hypothetical protein
LGDRRNLDPATTPGRPVGLGDDQPDLEARIGRQPLQGRDGEFRRAEEDDPHRIPPRS